MPITTTSKPPGRCRNRANSHNKVNATAPTVAATQFHCGSCSSNCGRKPTRLASVRCTPTTLATCLRMMVSARPKAKPRSTGLAMNEVTLPSLNSPASRKNAPVTSTRPMARVERSSGSPLARVAVAAASTAAEDEVAETMAKRLLPKSP
ncbi:hypothetical protein D3C76_1124460 [compost metagenome]